MFRVLILLLIIPHLILSSFGAEAIYEVPNSIQHACCIAKSHSSETDKTCCQMDEENEESPKSCDNSNCQSKGCTSSFQMNFLSTYVYSHDVFEKSIPVELNTLVINFISQDFHNIWIPPKDLI